MILSSTEIGQIERGEKSLVIRAKNRPLKVGREYPIQQTVTETVERAPTLRSPTRRWTTEEKERRETRFYVKVTQAWECEAHEIDETFVRKLGHESREAFLDWCQEKLGQRPEIKHQGESVPVPVPVWVGAIQVEERRFLAAGHIDPIHIPSDPRGYQHGPARSADDLEPVDDTTQQAISSGQLRSPSQRQFDLRTARERREWEERPLWQKVRELEQAHAGGHDVSRRLAAIRRMAEAGHKKIKREAA